MNMNVSCLHILQTQKCPDIQAFENTQTAPVYPLIHCYQQESQRAFLCYTKLTLTQKKLD